MAGTEAAKPPLPLETISALLKEHWPGADATDEEKVPVPAEAETMARRARRKYDGTLRWVLGVFSAVALLIFGSVPFADLENVDVTLLILGLLLAGLGLGVVIWAATTGLELHDASLGELAKTCSDAPETASWLTPRKQASARLTQILQGTEAPAHLGPGVRTVTGLIERLGALEEATLRAHYRWDGKQPPRLVDRDELQKSIAVGLVEAALAKEQLDSMQSVAEELRKQIKERDGKHPDAAAALANVEARYRTIAQRFPELEHLRGAALAQGFEELRQQYRAHRALVLDESLVAQMRGTFRVVRRWLMLGAALVLAGGTTVAYAVANPASADPQGSVSITLKAASKPWTALEECSGVAKDKELVIDGLLISSNDDDGAQDGPFTFVATVGDCAGTKSDVEEGEGTYVKKAPSQAPSAAPDSKSPTSTPVVVTIRANTPARRSLADCSAGEADLRADALMTSSDDSDGKQDGPFIATIASGPCAGRTLSIPQGDGVYQL